ncbi:hypothetical protein GCM10027284_38340 [Cyclobacterium sediminis]
MADKINFNDKYNQALSIVLIDKLKCLLNAHYKETIDYKAKDYTDKINKLIKEKYPNKDYDEVKVNKFFPQLVLRVFKCKPFTDTYKDKASFKKETINKFINVLKHDENINYGWDEFKNDFNYEANEELKNNPIRYGFKDDNQNAKIYFGINVMCFFCNKDKFRKEINDVIQKRIQNNISGNDIQLEFLEEDEGIKDLDHAKRIGVEKSLDLVMYANAVVEDKEQTLGLLKMDFHYAITNPVFLQRFNSCEHTISQTGNSESIELGLVQLYEGDLQTDIDQALYLLLALNFYLNNNPKKALDFLEKVIRGKRCDETWFIMGVCLFELGAFERAKECWEKILSEKEGLFKARINLALLYLQPEFKEKYWNYKSIIKDLISGDLSKECSDEEFFLPLAILFDEISDFTSAKHFFKKVVNINKITNRDYAYLRLSNLTDQKLINLRHAAKYSQDLSIHFQVINKIYNFNVNKKEKLTAFKAILKDVSNRKNNAVNHKRILKIYNDTIDVLELEIMVEKAKWSSDFEIQKYYISEISNLNLNPRKKLEIFRSIHKGITSFFRDEKEIDKILKIYNDKIDRYSAITLPGSPVLISENETNSDDSIFNQVLDVPSLLKNIEIEFRLKDIFDNVHRYVPITRSEIPKDLPILFLDSLTIKDDDLKLTNALLIQCVDNMNQIIETSKVGVYSYLIKRNELVNLGHFNTLGELLLSVSFDNGKNDKFEFIPWKSLKVYIPDPEALIKDCKKYRDKLDPLTTREFMEWLYSLFSQLFIVNYFDFELWFMDNFS